MLVKTIAKTLTNVKKKNDGPIIIKSIKVFKLPIESSWRWRPALWGIE